jgi:hypothetical protein
MTTILASTPCSNLDRLYGSMRGYAAIAPSSRGTAERRNKVEKNEKERTCNGYSYRSRHSGECGPDASSRAVSLGSAGTGANSANYPIIVFLHLGEVITPKPVGTTQHWSEDGNGSPERKINIYVTHLHIRITQNAVIRQQYDLMWA